MGDEMVASSLIESMLRIVLIDQRQHSAQLFSYRSSDNDEMPPSFSSDFSPGVLG
jgi:hypothetical protein